MAKAVIKQGDDVARFGEGGNRVFFSMAKTMNLGNYEAMRVEYGEQRTVKDGKSFAKARERVKKSVRRELKALIKLVEDTMQ